MSAACGPPHGLSTGPAIHARFGAFRRQGDRWDRHGSESYFVIGEGILAESVGGRNRTLARTAEAQAPPFRFSRMGPNGGAATAERLGAEAARRRDDVRGWRLVADPGELHVPRTPLWFYVLREAELNQGKLKGVGARIVAETFHRAMEGSQTSIVRDRADPRGRRPARRGLHGPGIRHVRGAG